MTRSLRILVVDDEVGFARSLGRSLRRLGHEPTLALHPDDALALFREQSFDAVITDIDMPEMNGVELARSLRKERGDVPIAFCTGSDPASGRLAEASTLGPVRGKGASDADVRAILLALAATFVAAE